MLLYQENQYSTNSFVVIRVSPNHTTLRKENVIKNIVMSKRCRYYVNINVQRKTIFAQLYIYIYNY